MGRALTCNLIAVAVASVLTLASTASPACSARHPLEDEPQLGRHLSLHAFIGMPLKFTFRKKNRRNKNPALRPGLHP